MAEEPAEMPIEAEKEQVSMSVDLQLERVEPPPIARIRECFIPLSHIVTALVRTAMLELRQLRVSLAELSDQRRKRRLVEYCAAFKTEFVKVLVLVDWAKDAEAVHRAIDVKAWTQGQQNCFDNLYGGLRWGVLRSMEQAKVRNPDLIGAVDVLTTGSFPRLRQTELARRYRMPRPIGPRQVLRTMQTMNALLSLRLQLYETLPWPMRDFTIASGRASFHVPDGFTITLSFACEQVDSPKLTWFLIDFTFEHETPQSLKLEIEAMANTLMAQAQAEGTPQLVALYDRLHLLCVLYKLERLFGQFSGMHARRRKLVDVKYASSQRKMVVGYWLDQRTSAGHARNAFTVTIAPRGVPARLRYLKTARQSLDYSTDALAVSWRAGGVKDDADDEGVPLPIDIDGLVAEALLDAVLAHHAERLLSTLHDALTLRSTLTKSSLTIDLTATYSLVISINLVNGQLVAYRAGKAGPIRIQDASILALQRQLNSTADAAQQASYLLSYQMGVVRRALEEEAALALWTVSRFSAGAFERDDFGRAFKGVHVTDCVFLTRSHEGWQADTATVGDKKMDGADRSAWFLVATLTRQAAEVVVQLFLTECGVDTDRGWYIQTVLAMPIRSQEAVVCDWQRLWRFATARILLLQVSRALTDRGCAYTFAAAATTTSTWRTMRVPIVQVAAKDMPYSKRIWSTTATWSLSTLGASCTLTLTAEQSTQASLLPLDLGGAERGLFKRAQPVTVKAGAAAVVAELLAQWKAADEAVCRIESLAKLSGRMTLTEASLAGVQLTYGASHQHALHIQDWRTLMLASLDASTTNPHTRVLPFLQDLLKAQGSVRVLCEVMLVTLPVLSLLDAIDAMQEACYIVARSVSIYRLYYPTRQAGIEIQLRPAMSGQAEGNAPEGLASWLMLDLASVGVEAGVRLSSVASKVGFKAMSLSAHATNVFGIQVPASATGDEGITAILHRVNKVILAIPERRIETVARPLTETSHTRRKASVSAAVTPVAAAAPGRRASKAGGGRRPAPANMAGKEVVEL